MKPLESWQLDSGPWPTSGVPPSSSPSGSPLYAVVAGGLAAYAGRRRLHESARNALIGAFVATAVAAFVLLHAFNARDFTFTYVADHSSRKLPFPYSLTGFWGGQEGSLLLWLFVLTALSSIAISLNREPDSPTAALDGARARRRRDVLRIPARRSSRARSTCRPRRSTEPASTRACRTRT